MKRPNLFIVGAPKCGTTSLHDYLDQHPEIFMSWMKEPDFFCTDMTLNEVWRKKTEEDYMSLFKDARDEKWLGESSVWYLASEAAPAKIKAWEPNSKIVIMLRNPVDAAYSQHGQLIWSCNEDILDFEEAVKAEPERRAGKRIPDTCTGADVLQYTSVFTYTPQVKRYFETFPREQVKVIIFEDFVKDTPRVYRETLEWLGVDATFQANLEVVNAVKPVSLGINRFFAKRAWLRGLVHKLVPLAVQRKMWDLVPLFGKTIKRPNKLDPEAKKRLMPLFADDVAQLSELLGRDLTHWCRGK